MASLMGKLVLLSALMSGLAAQCFALGDTTSQNTLAISNSLSNNGTLPPVDNSNKGAQKSSVSPTKIVPTDKSSQGDGFLSSSDSKILVLGILIIICQGFALFWIMGKQKKAFDSFKKTLLSQQPKPQPAIRPNNEIIIDRYLQSLQSEIQKVHEKLEQLISVSVPVVSEIPKKHSSQSATSLYVSPQSESKDLVTHKKPRSRMQDIADTVVRVINDMYDTKEAMNVDSVIVSVTSAIGEEKATQLSLICKGYFYTGSVSDSNIELFCLGSDTDLIAFPHYNNRENTGFDKWFDNGSSQGDKPKVQKLARAKLTAAGTVECLDKGIVG